MLMMGANMDWSEVVGWALVLVGTASILFGFFVAVVTTVVTAVRDLISALRPGVTTGLDWSKLPWEKIVDFLKELLGKPGGLFFVTGFIELAAGIWILKDNPF